MTDNQNNSNFEEELHVMPQQFYGLSGPKKRTFNEPQQHVPQVTQARPTSSKKKSKAWIGVLIFVLIILLGVSGWFLYLSYFTTIEQNEVVPVVEVEPIIEEEPVVEEEPEQVEASVVEEVEQVDDSADFLPADLYEKSLDMMATVDSDDDGLTDEEEYLLGLDPNKPDTDSDGYLDGEELLSLYNPAGLEPVAIEYSGLVTTYVNPTFDYDLFYPKKWLAKAVDQANLQVMFTSTVGEFVNVLVEENNENLTLSAWYMDQVPGLSEEEIVVFENSNGLEGVMSPDGFTAYFVKGRFIYILHYNIGLKEAVSYPNLFYMMVESFVFTGQQ